MAERPPRRPPRKPGSPARDSAGHFTGQRHIVIGGEDAEGNTVWVVAVDVDDPDELSQNDLLSLFSAALDRGDGSPPRGSRYISTAPIESVKIYRPSLRRRPVILPRIYYSDQFKQRPPETRPPRKPRTKK